MRGRGDGQVAAVGENKVPSWVPIEVQNELSDPTGQLIFLIDIKGQYGSKLQPIIIESVLSEYEAWPLVSVGFTEDGRIERANASSNRYLIILLGGEIHDRICDSLQSLQPKQRVHPKTFTEPRDDCNPWFFIRDSRYACKFERERKTSQSEFRLECLRASPERLAFVLCQELRIETSDGCWW